MNIEVTQVDIDLGVANSPCKCPLARAVRRHPKMRKSEIYLSGIRRGKKLIKLPFQAQKFIMDFDNWKPVKPFKFELKIP